MKLYYTEIFPGIGANDILRLKPLMPDFRRARPSSDRAQTIAAYALAAYALKEHGLEPDRLRRESSGGLTLDAPGCHICLSHTKTHALTAIGSCSVGCDIETIHPISPSVAERVCTPRELNEFTQRDDFFQFWCLKESWYKLYRGARKLSEAEFSIKNGVQCLSSDCAAALFDVPGCACAACAGGAKLPSAAQYVSLERLLSLTEENYD